MTLSPPPPAVRRPPGVFSDLGPVLVGLRLAVVVAVALLLQLTMFVEVRVVGVAPELPALVAVLAGLLAGARRGSVIAFWAGLVWDVYLTTPLGLAAAAFAMVAYALGSVTEDLFHDTRTQTAALVFVGTAASVTVYALLGEVVGQRGLVDDSLVRIVLVSSALNGLLSLAAAPTMRWALGVGRRRRAPGRASGRTKGRTAAVRGR